MDQTIDLAEIFSRLAQDGRSEEATPLGGVNVRCVRVQGGREGRWDSHCQTTETVIVWRGDFTVEYRDQTVHLAAGQCCVVPVGVEHRGSSQGGADVVLMQQAH